ncbi:MAG: phosphate signaling complex protein PhoU [Erysipelotrichia bacterium]|nr:phosphate signaling complex protein PhoU [Erysipelotrichia bacterium]
MRSHFDEQLTLLNKELIEMGGLCETIIALAFKAFDDKSIRKSKEVNRLDNEIIQKERTIESLCLKLLLQQQPVAKDLRLISAALKMIYDMKRIGDIALDIFEITAEENKNNESVMFHDMSLIAAMMVTKSVNAFVNSDIILAEEVIGDDDMLDNYFFEIRQELIRQITQNPEKGQYILDLLMVAKYLEKIGDHAVNISNWVIFSISGQHKEE